MVRVLVTGAAGPAGNNFINSLHMVPYQGNRTTQHTAYYVVGTDANRALMPLSSADEIHAVPYVGKPDYLETLQSLSEAVDVMHPQPDVEVYCLSENRERFDGKLHLPDKETVRLCQDKWETNQCLDRAGVPVPRTFRPLDAEEWAQSFAVLNVLHSPVWVRAKRGAGSYASFRCYRLQDGEFWVNYWYVVQHMGWGDFLACEYLPGREFAWQSVWWYGNLVVSQARQRNQHIMAHSSVTGQTSSPSVATTVHNDDVNRIATEAVKAVTKRPHGIFCVDLRENVSDIPCVTEINAGRFFTTSNFFAQAGCNMPDIFCRLALGHTVNVKPYNALPEGLKWIRQVDMGYKLLKD